MDPVSHLVFGRALAALAPRPAEDRGLTAALVIGSIALDADAVLMPTGWDWYLLWHQRGTHALVGTAIVSLALAGLVWTALRLLDARRASRGRSRGAPPAAAPGAEAAAATAAHPRVGPARFAHLWLAAWAGALGHITLDLVSGGTIRLFAPFDTTPFGLPWTAMADPLLALPLLAFLLAALFWRRHARRAAIVLMMVLASVLVVKGVSEQAARRVYRNAMLTSSAAAQPGAARADRTHASASPVQSGAARAEERATLEAVEARWGSPFAWAFYDRTPTQLRGWNVDARTGEVTLEVQRARPDHEDASTTAAPPQPANPPSRPAPAGAPDRASLIAASRDLQTVRHFFTLFELPLVETRPHADEVDVLWTDIRFCWATDCALWFGGTFDAGGRPRSQLVIIGRVRQSRPVTESSGR